MARKGKAPVDLADLVRAVEDQTSNASPLDRVAVAVKYGELLKSTGDDLVGHFVDEARRSGCSWAQIGAYLGVTKQAAQQRHTLKRLIHRGQRQRRRTGGGPLQRFTEEGRQVVVRAQEEARRLNHNYLGTEHLLLGLLTERQGAAASVLHEMGVSAHKVRSSVKRVIGEGTEPSAGHIAFTPRAKKVLALSIDAARAAGHQLASPEDMLVGLLEEGEGVAVEILRESGVTRKRVQQALGR